MHRINVFKNTEFSSILLGLRGFFFKYFHSTATSITSEINANCVFRAYKNQQLNFGHLKY